nr:hypothetical protein [Candidatus Sigynarchaeota archaeon]
PGSPRRSRASRDAFPYIIFISTTVDCLKWYFNHGNYWYASVHVTMIVVKKNYNPFNMES